MLLCHAWPVTLIIQSSLPSFVRALPAHLAIHGGPLYSSRSLCNHARLNSSFNVILPHLPFDLYVVTPTQIAELINNSVSSSVVVEVMVHVVLGPDLVRLKVVVREGRDKNRGLVAVRCVHLRSGIGICSSPWCVPCTRSLVRRRRTQWDIHVHVFSLNFTTSVPMGIMEVRTIAIELRIVASPVLCAIR